MKELTGKGKESMDVRSTAKDEGMGSDVNDLGEGEGRGQIKRAMEDEMVRYHH